MCTSGLYHDDPLRLRSEILIINHYTTTELVFVFGLSDIEEPLTGINKHSHWHFIYTRQKRNAYSNFFPFSLPF